jgi:hypothetical protein
MMHASFPPSQSRGRPADGARQSPVGAGFGGDPASSSVLGAESTRRQTVLHGPPPGISPRPVRSRAPGRDRQHTPPQELHPPLSPADAPAPGRLPSEALSSSTSIPLPCPPAPLVAMARSNRQVASALTAGGRRRGMLKANARAAPSAAAGEYICHHDDCRRRFVRKTSLTNHLKAHQNVKSRSIYRTKRARLRAAAAAELSAPHADDCGQPAQHAPVARPAAFSKSVLTPPLDLGEPCTASDMTSAALAKWGSFRGEAQQPDHRPVEEYRQASEPSHVVDYSSPIVHRPTSPVLSMPSNSETIGGVQSASPISESFDCIASHEQLDLALDLDLTESWGYAHADGDGGVEDGSSPPPSSTAVSSAPVEDGVDGFPGGDAFGGEGRRAVHGDYGRGGEPAGAAGASAFALLPAEARSESLAAAPPADDLFGDQLTLLGHFGPFTCM